MNNQKGHFKILLVFVILLSCSSCYYFGQRTAVTIEPTATLTPAATSQPTNIRYKFSVDDLDRTYWLHVPSDLDLNQSVPVVFVFHGLGARPQDMFKTGFNAIADQEGFIVVYPALGRGEQPVFIRQILSDLGAIVNIDSKRIYLTGYSLGGELAYRSACEMSDTIAAIAAVSGMGYCISSQPEQAVSVLHIHGLADDLVAYDGVGGKFFHIPVEEVISFWVQFNGCIISGKEEKNEKITHSTYNPCQDGTAVELYTIEAMGHKWPDKEMPTAQIIWDFFISHPKP